MPFREDFPRDDSNPTGFLPLTRAEIKTNHPNLAAAVLRYCDDMSDWNPCEHDRLRPTVLAGLRCHTDAPPCCRSVRFAAYDVQSFYAKATAALIAANDGEFFSIYTSETVMLS